MCIRDSSNSVETLILMKTLTVMESIADEKNTEKNCYKKSILLGLMISLGVFNRVTFPAFILLPCLVLFWKFYRTHWQSISLLSFSFLASSCLIVLIDTKIFKNGKGLIIAPWNNLKYNIDIQNLQLHGLHSRYTHLLVNLPQMLGPALLLAILSGYKLNQLSTYSIVSGILFLSLFQHQELRFLIPLVPLFITNLSWTRSSSILVNSTLFKGAWLLFNIIMGFIMGISHQSGIVQFLGDYSRFHSGPMGVHLWWKTYSPPTWMYMDNSLRVSSVVNLQNGVESIDEISFNVTDHHVIDLKGCDLQLLKDTIKRLQLKGMQTPLTLVTSDSMISKLKKLEVDEEIKLIINLLRCV